MPGKSGCSCFFNLKHAKGTEIVRFNQGRLGHLVLFPYPPILGGTFYLDRAQIAKLTLSHIGKLDKRDCISSSGNAVSATSNHAGVSQQVEAASFPSFVPHLRYPRLSTSRVAPPQIGDFHSVQPRCLDTYHARSVYADHVRTFLFVG